MKVKAIKDYNDLQLKRLVKADEIINVADARGNVLLKANVAIEVPTTPEVATEPVAKKATTRKKKVEG